ncbi:DUF6801 domain-containing protein [Actinomadura fulvescens]|uniref:Fibronectin type-III domain-containing protein n=1 Tax=Actinomadura fulvescens TaxID=46160 RepID=A0ABN3PFM4_9ACTN
MKDLITPGRRRATLVLAAAAAVVGGSIASPGTPAAVAEPTSINLKYSCKYPLIGEHELTTAMTLDFPKRVSLQTTAGKEYPSETIEAVATVNAETTDGLTAVGAVELGGTLDNQGSWAELGHANARWEDPAGGIENADQYFQVPKTRIPPAGAFKIKVSTQLLPLEVEKAGHGRFIVKDLQMKIMPRKADGKPTTLGTIDVTCKQRPDQKNVIAEYEVVDEPDTKAPSKPGAVRVTSKSSTQATLSWGRSADDFWVAGYDIYDGDKLVKQVNPGSKTNETLTGLTPGSSHSFTVKARDLSKNVSEASAPAQVTLDPEGPDTTPPSPPGKLTKTALTSNAAVVSWEESTDNVGVEGYNVYARDKGTAGERLAGTSVEPFGWATGLKPQTTYEITVRAKDTVGNLSGPSPVLTVTTPKGPPAECGKLNGDTPEWISACTYMAGFSNVKKLDSAVVLNDPAQNPVLTNVAYHATKTTAKAKFKFVASMQTRATMLTFGFMPTTATMELEQREVGLLEGQETDTGFKATANVKMTVRLLDATVNGTDLSLGKRCRSVRPMPVTLHSTPEYKNVKDGGPLAGTMTIPRFTGCGVGEDLDPLLNGAIAGGDNAIKIVQAPLCQLASAGCTPADLKQAR